MQSGRLHQLLQRFQSVLVEVDWQKDQAAVNDADRRLFATRKKTGFGNRVSDPQWLNFIS